MTTDILTSATEALKAIPSFHGINEYTLERAARAVAVAVLEHARDNVTDDMVTAGAEATSRKYEDLSSPYPTEEPDAGGGVFGYCFRAMLTVALAELETKP